MRRLVSRIDCRRSGLNAMKFLRRWKSPCVGLLLVFSTLVFMGPVAGAPVENHSQVQTNNTSNSVRTPTPHPAGRINITYTLRLAPNKEGQVLITANVTLPPDVSSFHIAPPDDATVYRTDGFHHDEGGVLPWEWNGSQRRVAITYLTAVNESSDGDIVSVGTGEWALFDWRTAGLSWEYERMNDGNETEPIEVARVAGQGVAGPNFAYLGAYQSYTRTVDETTIHLIVPKHAQPASRPQTMLSVLAKAERSLRMGAQTSHVDVFIAPPPISVSGLSGGVTQNGHRDMLVHQSTTLTTPDNVLLHEYIHTKQAYTTSEEMKWLTEASAEYYSAVLAYQQGLISFDEFHNYVTSNTYPSASLSTPDSWSSSLVPYRKGMRVLAALDVKIRTLSNGTQSLEDVFRRLNHHEGTVTYDVFATYVAQAAGESLTGWLDQHVQSSAVATVPATPSLYGPSTARTSEPSNGYDVFDFIHVAVANAPPILFVSGVLLALAGWARKPPRER